MFLHELASIQTATSFAFSAENPSGKKGGGSQGKPWDKLSPCTSVTPGETIVLAETDGPGVIQSMWFGSLPFEKTERCHLRREPDAVIPPVQIRGGGAPSRSIRTPSRRDPIIGNWQLPSAVA